MQNMVVDIEQKEALTQKLDKKELHFANQKTKEDKHRQSITGLDQVDHIEKELEERDEQIHYCDRKLRATKPKKSMICGKNWRRLFNASIHFAPGLRMPHGSTGTGRDVRRRTRPGRVYNEQSTTCTKTSC
jgi:2-oxoglutarate dehydrogenase complex dehydrogenase (E1) component-like enzyme